MEYTETLKLSSYFDNPYVGCAECNDALQSPSMRFVSLTTSGLCRVAPPTNATYRYLTPGQLIEPIQSGVGWAKHPHHTRALHPGEGRAHHLPDWMRTLRFACMGVGEGH